MNAALYRQGINNACSGKLVLVSFKSLKQRKIWQVSNMDKQSETYEDIQNILFGLNDIEDSERIIL